jgi:cytochrome b561
MFGNGRVIAVLSVLAALILLPSLAIAGGPLAPTEAGNELTEKLIANAGDNDHRMAYQADSITGVVTLAFVLLTAGWLNQASPSRRIVGTFLTAAMTLGIGLMVGWLHVIGSLDNVRAPILPTDELKPALMRMLGVAFTLAGLFLLLVTYWQTRRDDVLVLDTGNEEARYGRGTRFIHWTTAILFVALIPMGIFTSMIPEETWYRQGYYVVHKSLGLTVLLLVLVRLVWHRISPVPPLDSNLKTWERRSAHTAHVLLYVLMIGFPITGFVLSTFGGKYSHFFFWDTPLLWAPDADLIIPWAILHKLALPVLFYAVFAAHIAGALKHHFVDKHEGAFKRMVT